MPRIEPLGDGDVSSEIRERFRIAAERGAPNSLLLRILARDPNSMSAFYDAWNQVFYAGMHLDHELKELVRMRMARLRNCSY